MVEFKEKADKIIKERWGIDVEHICIEKQGHKWTYEKNFYKCVTPENLKKRLSCKNWFNRGKPNIYGFPTRKGPWCNKLKFKGCIGRDDVVMYAGIAADEEERVDRWNGRLGMPLVEVGWTEEMCRNGAKKTTCFHRFILPLPAAVAGFAIIKAWISLDCFGRIIRNYGRLC